MNGAHDLGGRHGFGPVDRSQTEDFIYPWEEKVLSLIHISEPTRLLSISYAVFCLKKKN